MEKKEKNLLEVEDVVRCLADGKISNNDLVRKLASKLTDPKMGELNKKLLKEHTGKVADYTNKTISLKPAFVGKSPEEVSRMLYEQEAASLPPPLPPRSEVVAPKRLEALPPKLPPKHKNTSLEQPSPGVKRRTLGTHRSSKVKQERSPKRKAVDGAATLPPPVPRPKATDKENKAIKKQDTEDEEAAGGDVFKSDDDEILRKKTSAFKERQKQSVKDLTQSFDTFATQSEVQLKDHLEKAKRRRPQQERQHQRAQSTSGEDYP